MNRSTIFFVFLAFVTFLFFGYLILAALGILAEPIKISDFALTAATLVLAWVTWFLAAATEGLEKSAQKQDEHSARSMEISGRMADAAKAQSEAAKAQLDIAKGQLDSANAERAKNLGDQLFEFDKILIANPELQIALEELRTSGKSFLAIKQDADSIKLKSFIYMHLNFFDEIVSTFDMIDESEDWSTYIIEKLQHPAFKEVMKAEGKIFGRRIGKFFEDNQTKIDSSSGTPWLW